MTDVDYGSVIYRAEFRAYLAEAGRGTVSTKLLDAIISHWWEICDKNFLIFSLVMWNFTGKLVTEENIKVLLTSQEKRALYVITSRYSFPGLGRTYIAEIVAKVLIDAGKEDLIHVYYNAMLIRKASLELRQLLGERHYRWVQKVLEMLEGANPSLRLPETRLSLGQGQIRP